ncbi:VCBS repeat-containing protein [Streptomyces sp. NRRL S-87]|uniref:FG-GAP repeat domain-containing protein n=1 Tax=Streptomyces sp. NRRL S-87 TaxID=1463920 RepID=UPI0004BE9BC9|nr:VCBS repeat-containing protein [Streptomyces sp. NRRL S-87]
MPHRRTTRRLLTAAVTTALALTAGPLALPATAATGAPPLAATADGTATELPRIAPDAQVLSAGPSGFLTSGTDHHALTWTRYADGATTRLDTDYWYRYGLGALSDTVATAHSDGATLHDMGTGVTTPCPLAPTGRVYLGLHKTTALAWAPGPTSSAVHLLQGSGRGATDREVALPWRANHLRVVAHADDAFVLQYDTGGAEHTELHQAVVDVAAGRITDTYRVWDSWGNVALSRTHIAWTGRADGVRGGVLRLAARGSTAVARTAIGGAGNRLVGLLDGWWLAGEPAGLDSGDQGTDYGLYATPLGGGPAVRLLDHASSLAPGPNGTLFATGGTLARGEGLYRIAAARDGGPRATLVATSGLPTRVSLLDTDLPAVVRLDGRRTVRMRWLLSRTAARVRITLRHTATGDTNRILDEEALRPDEHGWVTFDWDTTVATRQAPNGAYTWTLTASPDNGIGPALKAGGGFTVRRSPAPHDFTDDGTPDLLGTTRVGQLIGENSRPRPGVERAGNEAHLGDFWRKYTALTVAGDVAGSTHADLLARDAAGVLWLYTGKGDGTVAGRTRIGAGWNAYDALAAGGDLTGDGRADLVARDKGGALWLYAGTGSAAAPYKARTAIGAGWGGYTALTATGNVAGGGAGDLLARDKAGVLWLYRGRGDGTFGGRTRIGGGWNAYADLVGWGDADGDGRPDLYARDTGGRSWFYRGTGDTAAPFAPRRALASFFTDQPYVHVL